VAPEIIPTSGVPINFAVVGFATLLALATGMIFGIVPALQMSRPDVIEALRDSSRSTTSGGAAQRVRGAFVVAQGCRPAHT
jgi:hypothetical protein